MSNIEAWDRAAFRYQEDYRPARSAAVPYGPGLPDDAELRMLPPYAGKRVIDLGCGAGAAAIAFSGQASRTIAVDASAEQLAAARRQAEAAGAKIDFHKGELADLAFVTAESIDLVFSASTLDYVEDLDRVLRSVFRVLNSRGAFVFTLEHPLALLAGPGGGGKGGGSRRYTDRDPLKVERHGETFLVWPRTLSEVVSTFGKAGFRLEALAEPTPPGAPHPVATVWRIRKDGR